MMGLPIRKLVVATNENDVLDEFFKTGSYAPRGSDKTYLTSSPSMDSSLLSYKLPHWILQPPKHGQIKILWMQ